MTGSYKDKTQIHVKNRTLRSVCESVNGHPYGKWDWSDMTIMVI